MPCHRAWRDLHRDSPCSPLAARGPRERRPGRSSLPPPFPHRGSQGSEGLGLKGPPGGMARSSRWAERTGRPRGDLPFSPLRGPGGRSGAGAASILLGPCPAAPGHGGLHPTEAPGSRHKGGFRAPREWVWSPRERRGRPAGRDADGAGQTRHLPRRRPQGLRGPVGQRPGLPPRPVVPVRWPPWSGGFTLGSAEGGAPALPGAEVRTHGVGQGGPSAAERRASGRVPRPLSTPGDPQAGPLQSPVLPCPVSARQSLGLRDAVSGQLKGQNALPPAALAELQCSRGTSVRLCQELTGRWGAGRTPCGRAAGARRLPAPAGSHDRTRGVVAECGAPSLPPPLSREVRPWFKEGDLRSTEGGVPGLKIGTVMIRVFQESRVPRVRPALTVTPGRPWAGVAECVPSSWSRECGLCSESSVSEQQRGGARACLAGRKTRTPSGH